MGGELAPPPFPARPHLLLDGGRAEGVGCTVLCCVCCVRQLEAPPQLGPTCCWMVALLGASVALAASRPASAPAVLVKALLIRLQAPAARGWVAAMRGGEIVCSTDTHVMATANLLMPGKRQRRHDPRLAATAALAAAAVAWWRVRLHPPAVVPNPGRGA